jgi:acyl-coenzyme A synthetase/AMP-(fatty) acid ligase
MNNPFNLVEYCIENSYCNYPDKTAIIFTDGKNKETKLTYSQLRELILKNAFIINSMNQKSGSRILIRLEHSIDYAILFLACISIGLVPVPISPHLTSDEVEFIYNDSEASLIFCSPKLKINDADKTVIYIENGSTLENANSSNIEKYKHTLQNDPAFLIYTSGTTDVPKGVLHAHRVILGRIPMFEGWTGISESDIIFHAGELNWTYTIGIALFDTFVKGATSVLFDGERNHVLWLELIEKYKVSIFVSVPSLYRKILKYENISRFDLTELKYGLTAGEAMQIELYDEWKNRTGKELFESLGMSEISTYISSSNLVPVKKGCSGKPQAGRNILILPIDGGEKPVPINVVGLIAVHKSDPGLMLKYWNRVDEEKLFFRSEWFIGGDLASVDEEGYIHYHGRNNELMKAFGYRVSPLEVEKVIHGHASVLEVGVAEKNISSGLSIICAWIVLKNTFKESESLKEEIIDYAAIHLADYKCPREIIFIDKLPRTPNGKLKRKEL